MKKPITYFPGLLFFLTFTAAAYAQQPRFYNDIQAFKKKDSIHFPPKGAIVFAGSSSFTKWTDIEKYFPGYSIINRGFGGSSFTDVIKYEKDIIFPYQPKQVVIYCGDNDLAASDTVTAQIVFQRFKTLFQDIRMQLPNAGIVFVSIKPSPSRQRLMPEMKKANELIKQFLLTKKNTAFADVYNKMLTQDGMPIKDIFISDSLHMNEKGYAIWKKVIEPYLIE
jgi:lysophospholipase L1-like esterase